MTDTFDPYNDIFESWADVQEQFQMEEPEPDEVFYASYTYEDYSGWATVIYRRGDTFYEATGSHCSCYGLEDQWDPEAYDGKTLVKCLERRSDKKFHAPIIARINESLGVLS